MGIVRSFRTRPAAGSENLVFGDTGFRNANTTPGLWDDCPLLVYRSDPSYGKFVESNFLNTTIAASALGGWTTTTATSGAVTIDATRGLKVDAGAVTANQGVNLQMSQTPFTPTANKPIWLEANILFTALTSLKIQFLFGLVAAQTACIASGAIGTDDKAAFDFVGTTGVVQTDTTLSTVVTNGTGFTIVNSTAYKLGIKCTNASVSYWVNGVLVNTTAAAPAAALAPTLCVQANATVQPIVFMSYFACFQQR